MARRVDRILSDPVLHGRLRKNAESRARAFAWERMVDRYEASYAAVIARAGKQDSQ
jgi:hypothetical protein